MTARRPESENDSWHIWMCFTWLDDYRESLRMQATEETNLQNWGFNIWCLVLAWRRLAVRALSLLEKCSGTMPEHGIPVCCESDCKWKTFVINGELFSRIVNSEVINDQVIPIFGGNIPPLIQCELWLWPPRGGLCLYRGCHGRRGGRGGGAGGGGGGRHRGGGGGGQDPGLGLQLRVLPSQFQVDINACLM